MVALFAFAFGGKSAMYSGEHTCECEAWRENVVVVVVFFVFEATASSLSASSRLTFSSSSLSLFRTSSSWSPTPNNFPLQKKSNKQQVSSDKTCTHHTFYVFFEKMATTRIRL